MKQKLVTLAATIVFLATVGSATLALAQQSWKYKCPQCGLVLTYTMPQGGLRCPSDRTLMQLSR
jgi:predicted RNA-binding Zn-ribbon protein involved in translation (DUF1610 family)